ncbi:hypothetical protein [Megasphaera cerevisiae]|jgi:hypothetical protein|uniref:hypothetical protein n=1 Tax=Megasphaera cerevisiae TaxID=39029 RepID=UPI000944C14A|nr:hypothetical protein [Megasphaera cerevisiae]OKY52981.1 hypothetical protein BSR42_09865 [Megasphaera cerevisiae]
MNPKNLEMKNTILVMSEAESHQWSDQYNAQPKTFCAEIDGRKIDYSFEYIQEIEIAFQFPVSCNDDWDTYIRYMKGLHWLDMQKHVLIFHYFRNDFLNNPILRGKIILSFAEEIIPFWKYQTNKKDDFTLILAE